MRVASGPRDIPVAGQDYAAFGLEGAAEVHDARLEAALQLVAVAGEAAGFIEVRLRGAVDRVEIDDREAASTNDDDAPFAIPRGHLCAPGSFDEGRHAVHAPAAEGDVPRVARQRVVTAVARQGVLERADRVGIAFADAKRPGRTRLPGGRV